MPSRFLAITSNLWLWSWGTTIDLVETERVIFPPSNLGKALGFEVEALEAHYVEEIQKVSSARFVNLRQGDITAANQWLGDLYPLLASDPRKCTRQNPWRFPQPIYP